MAASNEFESQWLECQQKYGKGIDAGGIDEITDADEIAEQVTLPGVEVDQNGAFTRYVYAKFSLFKQAAQRAATAIQNTWNLWFGADATSGVQKQWADLSADAVAKTNAANTAAGYANTQGDYAKAKGDEARAAVGSVNTAIANAEAATSAANTAASNANTKATLADQKATLADTAASNANNKASLADTAATNANNAAGRVDAAIATADTDHTRAESDHSTAAADHTTAQGDHSTAQSDHTASQAATTGASNVNAQLSGTTVTITNRQGQATSVDIGFEIYRTYGSVAAMNADAANVPAGKFVIIATTDPTDPDNAKLYAKSNSGSFTFLSDLDQASSAAWADWLNNMKPQIESAVSTAASDHTTAEADHSQATSDHANYTADRQTFATNEAERQQTFEDNEAEREQTFVDNEADRMASMMISRCFVDFTTMCLMFVQPQADTTAYKVRNGDLNITFQYEA